MGDNAERYLYSGYSIGAAAQFDRLDPDPKNKLHHPIYVPTLGGSVLSTVGGIAKAHVSDFCFSVDHPRRATLLSVRRIDTTAKGIERDGIFETEVEGEIQAITFVEMLRVDFIQLHMLSARQNGKPPQVSTRGNKIEGMRLGAVEAKIILDDEPLCHAGTRQQLADFYRAQDDSYRKQFSWRFHPLPDATPIEPCGEPFTFTLVKEIKLIGPDEEKDKIKVQGNTIFWPGFGKIIVAEVVVKDNDRKLTLVRTEMGSPAGGSSSAGDGQSNGQLSG
jgi:hypothetical protein